MLFIRSSTVNVRPVFLARALLPLALFLGVLLLAAPAASAAGPSISASPMSGAVGTGLTVNGTGWTAGDEIQVQIGGATVCQVMADSGGGVSGDQSNGCRVPPGLSPGSYALTADDITSGSTGATGSGSFTVPTGPLTAAFTPTLATVLAGTSVLFDASGSSDPGGDIDSYSWDFGDGSSATGIQTSHSYLNTGTFLVTLTISDGSDTASASHQVTVIAPPPLQTLILTPVATPAIVTSGHVSTTRAGAVDLGERLFCPGDGPDCTALILATSSSLAQRAGVTRPSSGISAGSARAGAGATVGSATIVIRSNRSAEMTFKLSRAALSWLRKRHRLRARVKIVAARGDQTAARVVTLMLQLR